MLRFLLTLLVSLMTVGLASADALAKDNPSQPDSTKVGVGMSMDVISQLQMLGYLGYLGYYELDAMMGAKSVRVPIILNGGLRSEPELNYLRLSDDGDAYGSTEASVAVAPSWRVAGKGSAYAGGRLGSQVANQNGERDLNLTFGGLAGGEYWIGRGFSVGGEVGLDFIKYHGDASIGASMHTTAALIARFYFN
jgi:hypothetical protein